MTLLPKIIALSGGAGQIAYSALFQIASGRCFGPHQPIILKILETPEAIGALEGVVMELVDCAFPLLKEVHISSDAFEVFEGAQIALLIGAKPRKKGMERKDLLTANGKIFAHQGKALSDKADKDLKILVVGNPCNTNALILLQNGPNLNPKRVFAMTRLDENRAKALLAKKAQVDVEKISCMAIWGNHSATQIPDFVHAKIDGKPALEVIKDRTWCEGPFIQTVQQRGAMVIKARGRSSAASAANAAIDSIVSLTTPTKAEDWFSVGLLSDGNPYGVEEGLVFSFPCRLDSNGEVQIVEGLRFDPFLEEKIQKTTQELVSERALIQKV